MRAELRAELERRAEVLVAKAASSAVEFVELLEEILDSPTPTEAKREAIRAAGALVREQFRLDEEPAHAGEVILRSVFRETLAAVLERGELDDAGADFYAHMDEARRREIVRRVVAHYEAADTEKE